MPVWWFGWKELLAFFKTFHWRSCSPTLLRTTLNPIDFHLFIFFFGKLWSKTNSIIHIGIILLVLFYLLFFCQYCWCFILIIFFLPVMKEWDLNSSRRCCDFIFYNLIFICCCDHFCTPGTTAGTVWLIAQGHKSPCCHPATSKPVLKPQFFGVSSQSLMKNWDRFRTEQFSRQIRTWKLICIRLKEDLYTCRACRALSQFGFAEACWGHQVLLAWQPVQLANSFNEP